MFGKESRALMMITSGVLTYHLSRYVFPTDKSHTHKVSPTMKQQGKDTLNLSKPKVNFKNFIGWHSDFEVPQNIISKHIKSIGIDSSKVDNAINVLKENNKTVDVTHVLDQIKALTIETQQNQFYLKKHVTQIKMMDIDEKTYEIETEFEGSATSMPIYTRMQSNTLRVISACTVFCTTSLACHLCNVIPLLSTTFLNTGPGIVFGLGFLVASSILYFYKYLYKTSYPSSTLELDEPSGVLKASSFVQKGQLQENPSCSRKSEFIAEALLGTSIFYVSEQFLENI